MYRSQHLTVHLNVRFTYAHVVQNVKIHGLGILRHVPVVSKIVTYIVQYQTGCVLKSGKLVLSKCESIVADCRMIHLCTSLSMAKETRPIGPKPPASVVTDSATCVFTQDQFTNYWQLSNEPLYMTSDAQGVWLQLHVHVYSCIQCKLQYTPLI